jgi:hypothetical protein
MTSTAAEIWAVPSFAIDRPEIAKSFFVPSWPSVSLPQTYPIPARLPSVELRRGVSTVSYRTLDTRRTGDHCSRIESNRREWKRYKCAHGVVAFPPTAG